jgi:hypothetical protein
MKNQTKNLLFSFYFGSLDEKDRLTIERELLTNEEFLVDYLDLKRMLEDSALLSSSPSPGLWQKIKPQKSKGLWLSMSVGAIAASVLAFAVFFQAGENSSTELEQPSIQGALIDSSSEHFVSSGVL